MTVKRQFFGAGSKEPLSAFGTNEILTRSNGKRGRKIMTVRAAMIRQSGISEPETVKQFSSRSKRTADTGNAWPLTQRQGGGNVKNFVDASPRRLRHTSSRIGGKSFKIPSRSFRIKNAERQRRLAGTGYARYSYDLVQWDVDVNVLQIVYASASHLNSVDHLNL